MQLLPDHEHIGNIVKIIDEQGYIKIIFSIMTVLELPTDAIPMEVLRSMVGKQVGIINIDGKYHVRTISPEVKTKKITNKGAGNPLYITDKKPLRENHRRDD